jgi:hypothetical protein
LKWVTQSNDINGILNFFVLRKKWGSPIRKVSNK